MIILSDLINDIVLMDQDLFPFPWPKESWIKVADDESYVVFGILIRNSLVAFALFKVCSIDHMAHLLKIITQREFKRKGLGQHLLRRSMDDLRQAGFVSFHLEVEEKNRSAIDLYKKCGFHIIHKAINYYGSGNNALKMQCATGNISL